MATRIRNKLTLALSLAVMLALLLAPFVLASSVDESIVDATAPTGSVTLDPAGSASIMINLTVTGNQVGTATFDVYRDWTLSGGVFSGSNPQTFTVPPRAAQDTATTFSTSGTIAIDAEQAEGTFTLAVGAFNISNSNQTGAKLAAGSSSSYQVTVSAPPPPSDTTPPEISYVLDPASPDGVNGWYKSNVTLTWTVTEDESPDSLVKTGCVDQDITADQPATTYSCSATSDGGSAGPVTASIKRDATVPTLDPSVSPNPVLLNGSATASPKADDATSGVASSGCDPVDTSSVGIHTVQCFATDNAGNTATTSASYTVNYNLCVLYDQTKAHKSGSTVPIKLQLCDVNEVNFSASSAIVTALNLVKIDNSASGIIEDSGNANPDNNFRYDPTLGGTGGYIYNLSTKGLASGTWKLPFKVDNATSPDYWVKFDVK
jgi:hypothetical protein